MNIRSLSLAALMPILGLLAPSAQAQEMLGPIATDRPGNGNAATVMAWRRLNIEASVAGSHDNPTGVADHVLSLPLLMRFGLHKRAELRVGANFFELYHPVGGPADVTSGAFVVGTKLRLSQAAGARPALALSADLGIDLEPGLGLLESFNPDVRLLGAWALPAGFGLLLNIGVDAPDLAGEREVALIHVVNLGYTLPVADGRASIFIESFGKSSLRAGAPPILQVDVGGAFRLTDELQIDTFVQLGASEAAPDVQLSLGFSARI